MRLVPAFVLATLALPSAFSFGQKTTVPAPHRWLMRHQELNQRIAAGGARLVFLGDSITEGWEGEGAEVWAKFYGDRAAVNLGISGDRTQNVLWRIENGNLAGANPAVAVVLIGVNNLASGDSPDDVAAGVAAVVSAVRSHCPQTKVLLLDVFPAAGPTDDLRKGIEAVNAKIAALADGESVQVLDLGTKFVNGVGRIPRAVMGDALHPSTMGYELWARGMEPKLAEMLGQPAKELPLPESLQKVQDLALDEIHAFIQEQHVDLAAGSTKTHLPKPPKLTFDPGHRYLWNIVTNYGPITVELMPDVAPMHASSTIYLTEVGFYDDLTFHRVIPGFMAQGGCPLGNGTGGPGYGYDGEFKAGVVHDRRGLLSMANTGRPGSDGSQFFLTFVPTPHLNGKHTIFGEVVEGMGVLDELEKRGSPAGATSEPLRMIESTIEVKERN